MRSFDIILGGYMTIDNGLIQIDSRLALELDIAFISKLMETDYGNCGKILIM